MIDLMFKVLIIHYKLISNQLVGVIHYFFLDAITRLLRTMLGS